MSAPEWLVPGAEVAEVVTDRRAPTLATTTIDRIGKRDVVLANGSRFNVNVLTRNEGGTWGWTVRLLPIDAPEVDATRRVIRERNARSQARLACENLDKALRTNADAESLRSALAALTGHVETLLDVTA